jgi:hypothetical protein
MVPVRFAAEQRRSVACGETAGHRDHGTQKLRSSDVDCAKRIDRRRCSAASQSSSAHSQGSRPGLPPSAASQPIASTVRRTINQQMHPVQPCLAQRPCEPMRLTHGGECADQGTDVPRSPNRIVRCTSNRQKVERQKDDRQKDAGNFSAPNFSAPNVLTALTRS